MARVKTIKNEDLRGITAEILRAIKNKKAWGLYKEYTAINYHTEAVLVIAHAVGDNDDVTAVQNIWLKQSANDGMSMDETRERYAIQSSLWQQFIEYAKVTEKAEMKDGGSVRRGSRYVIKTKPDSLNRSKYIFESGNQFVEISHKQRHTATKYNSKEEAEEALVRLKQQWSDTEYFIQRVNYKFADGGSVEDGGSVGTDEREYDLEIRKTPDSSWEVFNKKLITKIEANAIIKSLKDLGYYDFRVEVPLPFENGGVVYAKGKVLRENATHKAVSDSGVVKVYEKGLPLYMANAHEAEAHPEWFDDKYLYSVNSEGELERAFQDYDEDNRVDALEYEKEFAEAFKQGGNVNRWHSGWGDRVGIKQLSFSKTDYDVNVNLDSLEVDVNIKANDSVDGHALSDTDAHWNQHGWGYMVYPKTQEQLFAVLRALKVKFSEQRVENALAGKEYGNGGEVSQAPDDFDYQYLKWLKEKKSKKIFFGWW